MSGPLSGMVSLSDIRNIEAFKPDHVREASSTLVRSASDVVGMAEQASASQGFFAATYRLRGVTESAAALVRPALDSATGLRDSAQHVSTILGQGAETFAAFVSRRSALCEEVKSVYGEAPSAIARWALRTCASELPHWSQVPELVEAEAGVRVQVDAFNSAVDEWEAALAERIDVVAGVGTPGSPLSGKGKSVSPVDLVLPFPVPAVPAIPGAGAGASAALEAAAAAAAALAALGLLGLFLLFGLSGDAAQDTPEQREKRAKARAEWAKQMGALADYGAYRHTHASDGTLLNEAGEVAEGDDVLPDTLPMPGEAKPKDAGEIKDYVEEHTGDATRDPHRQVETPQEVLDIFKEITKGGKPFEPKVPKEGTSFVRMPDGTIVVYRPSSRSGGPTVDVQPPPGSGKTFKVHLPEGWGK